MLKDGFYNSKGLIIDNQSLIKKCIIYSIRIGNSFYHKENPNR